MLLIVMHHYVVNSGLFDEMFRYPTSSKSLFLYMSGMWGKTGINSFVLITGYFMCRSRISLNKFVKLLFQIEFYNILLGITFLCSGYTTLSLSNLLQIVNPFSSVSTDFVSCFLLFYLFIPFLNILISNLTKSQHALLVFLSLSTYTILGSIPWIGVTFNYVTWFCVIYFVAAYIRYYGIWREGSKKFWGRVSLTLVAVSALSVLAMLLKEIYMGGKIDWSSLMFFVSDSNKLLAFLVSVSTFMFFKSVHIRRSKFINTIASCTFGVLLIHANSDAMRQWLWKDTFDNVGKFHSNVIYVHALLVPVIVFVVCAIIDYGRQCFVEKPFLDKIVRLIRNSRLYITTFK